MIEKILVPLDGSELSELALQYAEELGWALGAELHLLSLCELAEKGYLHMCELYLDGIVEKSRKNIRDYEPQGSREIKIKAATLEGNPAAEILRYAEGNAIDLVILTSHGRSGHTGWSMGSTANKIVPHARQPVLLVRASTSFPHPPRKEVFGRILVPLDGSEIGEAALPYVREITEKLPAEVTLLHVVPTGQYVRTFGGLRYFLFPEQQVEKSKVEAAGYLQAAGAKAKGEKATVKAMVVTGDPAQEIIRLSRVSDTRLVAMPTHGHSGIERWTLGSVAFRVIQHGDRPLLVVRARE